jgi:hypothetical protein
MIRNYRLVYYSLLPYVSNSDGQYQEGWWNFLPPNRHTRWIYRRPQPQPAEMNPPNPPPGGVDPLIAAHMRMMQQMATLWQICVLRCSRNARRCVRKEKRYAKSCARREKRYARREGRNSSCNSNFNNSSNNNKYHCLLHHHQFHLMISTGNL